MQIPLIKIISLDLLLIYPIKRKPFGRKCEIEFFQIRIFVIKKAEPRREWPPRREWETEELVCVIKIISIYAVKNIINLFLDLKSIH